MPITLSRKLCARWKAAILRLVLRRTQPEEWETLIPIVTPVLKQLAWASPIVKRQLQRQNVNVLPVHFYSNSPSLEDIETSYEYDATQTAPYRDDTLFDAAFLERTLQQLMPFAGEFCPAAEGDEVSGDRFFWNNSQFSHSDALAYYCFIRLLKPETIVEIGSGFSTLVALEAVRRNGQGRIVCVEPYPRPFLAQNTAITLIQKTAQSLTADQLNSWLKENDILFIDSTHTVKTGSDCLHLYLRLLPRIQQRIFVHAHDIFLPFGLPQDWLLEKQIFWTEQYLLLALLTDNPRAKVWYGSAYHEAFNPGLLRQFTDDKWNASGGSFWWSYQGSPPSP